MDILKSKFWINIFHVYTHINKSKILHEWSLFLLSDHSIFVEFTDAFDLYGQWQHYSFIIVLWQRRTVKSANTVTRMMLITWQKSGIFKESFYLTSLEVCNNLFNNASYVNYVNSPYTNYVIIVMTCYVIFW